MTIKHRYTLLITLFSLDVIDLVLRYHKVNSTMNIYLKGKVFFDMLYG